MSMERFYDDSVDPRMPITFIPPTNAKVSWWLTCDRITLSLEAEKQRQRMRNSKEFYHASNRSLETLSAPLPVTCKQRSAINPHDLARGFKMAAGAL